MNNEVKTNQTHPIRIDWVKPDNATGSIGMTFCPGKKLTNAYSEGDWDRDIDIDLQAIVDSGAWILVSLVEDAEFEEMGVRDLPQKAMDLGLFWYHLPIRDGGIPGAGFEVAWNRISSEFRRRISGGRNIVVHCNDGIGRTGLVTARLLIEQGDKIDAAIDKVRHARPGSIETKEQEAYLQDKTTRVVSKKEILRRRKARFDELAASSTSESIREGMEKTRKRAAEEARIFAFGDEVIRRNHRREIMEFKALRGCIRRLLNVFRS